MKVESKVGAREDTAVFSVSGEAWSSSFQILKLSQVLETR